LANAFNKITAVVIFLYEIQTLQTLDVVSFIDFSWLNTKKVLAETKFPRDQQGACCQQNVI